MKNIFENAVVEIVEFSVNDIITTSDSNDGEPDMEG
jgi:hypothetical protein